MKIVVLFLLIGITQTFALDSYAQTKRISLNLKNATINRILDEIEDQSEFYFMFDGTIIDVYQRKSINCENQSITTILDQLLKDTHIVYEISDRQIVLFREQDSEVGQQKTISGKVTDSGGSPLPGVTVVIKGTTHGTVTNADGEYSLANVSEDATLVFSFVGMKTQEVAVGPQTTINVKMEEETIGLEEVVAVGYGTQKKVNLTGSVSTANMEELERKTVTQASQALVGNIPGASIRQASGIPGKNQTTIRIRGLGTFSNAGNSPLIIIDGISGSMDDVNPNDIKSISVLKDAASSAIYGSRAANGVVLIETNEGRKDGKLHVSYNAYMGKQEASEILEFVDSWTFAEATNEMNILAGNPPTYTQEDINKFKSGVDPDNYPNKHHYKDFFTGGNGLQTKHNLAFEGGTNKTNYLFSFGYLKQNGITPKTWYNRYDIHANINSKLSDNLSVNFKLSGYQDDQHEPQGYVYQERGGIYHLVRQLTRLPATIPGKRSDGYYGHMESFAPEAMIDSESFHRTDKFNIRFNSSLEWNILKGLKFNGTLGYLWNESEIKGKETKTVVTEVFTSGPSELNQKINHNKNITLNGTIDYETKFENHYLNLLIGYSQESFRYKTMSGFRNNLANNNLSEFDAASASAMRVYGSSSAIALKSYFGRINYNYKEKYLLEGNLRYDGSSRFNSGNRYGLFPSFSAGWRISEESFFQLPAIDNLKLRASYGVLGNQAIGTYPYQKVLSLSPQYPFGGNIESGAALGTLPSENISWESTKIIDLGIDLTAFNNKLDFSVDYYNKKTEDILYRLAVSSVLGMGVGEQNAGEVENKGWEFSLTYRNKIGNFAYSITPNFSTFSNKVISLANIENDISHGLFIGHPLQSIWGYETEGLFTDQKDIDTYATQPYTALPGLIRYKDISGPDGVPDGLVNAEYDRKVIGSTLPKYLYAMGFTAKYKQFDLFIQLQGEGGNVRRVWGKFFAFHNSGNATKWAWEHRWSPENPNPNAEYPRLTWTWVNDKVTQASTFWLKDASYLRVKNVQFGYKLPSKFITNNFRGVIDNARIYFSGENLLTFHKFFKGYDPEMEITMPEYEAAHYPPTRLFLLGLSINF